MVVYFVLNYAIIFFFSLPSFSFSSCPLLTCDTSIDIQYPFYTLAHHPGCNGTYHIYCNGSTPTIRFEDNNKSYWPYMIKNISYPEKTITLQDQEISTLFHESSCSSLYDFTHPLPHFEHASHPILDNSFFTSCLWKDYSSPYTILDLVYNSEICKDYNIYYGLNSEILQKGVPPNCHAPKSPLFQWKLSFEESANGLSLLSAGFSQDFELRPDCFNKSLCVRLKKKSNLKIIVPIAASAGAATAFVAVCFVALCWCKCGRQRFLFSWRMPLKLSYKKDPESGEANYRIPIFSYDELHEATNGFDDSRELGEGGFGTVYKGKLRDGRTVAVKRLFEKNYRKLEQFINEVDILSCLHHQHLVRLYGCTSRQSRELLLVYEFVPNGTVADHLYGARASTLPWNLRLSIAIETADALAYLHSIEPQIVHRDIKSNNILLDNDFHVKVADFGLSRLFPLDVTHVSTAPQGTPGYVDPEYHQCYQLTDKSDVYSFGVILVELISSKPAVDISRDRHEINLANMALTKIQNCQFEQLVDPLLGYQSNLEVTVMIEQVAELAFMCLQFEREMRPSIKEVLEVLRAMESRNYKVKRNVDDAEVNRTKEETRLLNNVSAHSPDSVTERWQNRSTGSTTSNTSA